MTSAFSSITTVDRVRSPEVAAATLQALIVEETAPAEPRCPSLPRATRPGAPRAARVGAL
jgi:hypothetical protein